jgi:hypothetical protein
VPSAAGLSGRAPLRRARREPTAPVEAAAVESTSTAVGRAAVEPAGRSPAAEPPLTELPGLMPLLVLGGRPAHALPAARVVVLEPLAALAPIHVAVAPRVRVDPGSPHSTAREMPADAAGRQPAGEARVIAPVVVDVHVTDAVMAKMMADGEAELEVGEEADAPAQVERPPAPGDRPGVPEGARPVRIVVAGAVDHERARRHH